MKGFFYVIVCLAPRKYGLVGTACRCGMEQSEPEFKVNAGWKSLYFSGDRWKNDDRR